MNRSAVKVQEKSGTDLRHDEVDGHLLARKAIEDLGSVEKGLRWGSWKPWVVPPPGK